MNPRGYYELLTAHVSPTWDSVCLLCGMKAMIAIFTGAAAFLLGSINHELLVALSALVAIDFITGIGQSYHNGEIIQSRKALKSASKLVIYMLFISAGHLTSFIVLDSDFVENVIISFLALTELVSIMENIGKMGYTVPLTLLNRLKDLRNLK